MTASTTRAVARLCHALAGALLLLAAFIHARGYPHLAAGLSSSNLPIDLVNGSKVLWWSDSTTCALMGVLFAFATIRNVPTGALVVASSVPLAIAALLYLFMGNFPGAHLLTIAATLGLAGAALRSTS